MASCFAAGAPPPAATPRPSPAATTPPAATASPATPPLTLNAQAADIPSFIKNPLAEKRGVILLVYVAGATEDMARCWATSTPSRPSTRPRVVLLVRGAQRHGARRRAAQLKISQPPALAVISPDGSVYQEYTGWISEKVMSQVVANAARQVRPLGRPRHRTFARRRPRAASLRAPALRRCPRDRSPF